jgi:hypothetical protein
MGCRIPGFHVDAINRRRASTSASPALQLQGVQHPGSQAIESNKQQAVDAVGRGASSGLGLTLMPNLSSSPWMRGTPVLAQNESKAKQERATSSSHAARRSSGATGPPHWSREKSRVPRPNDSAKEPLRTRGGEPHNPNSSNRSEDLLIHSRRHNSIRIARGNAAALVRIRGSSAR